MTGRLTAALLGIWLVAGATVEARAWDARLTARHAAEVARLQAVAMHNLTQAHRFIGGCLRGELAPLGDELLFDCRDDRKPMQSHLSPRHVREELEEIDRQWRAANNRTS